MDILINKKALGLAAVPLILVIIIATAGGAEIRGTVATGDFMWNPQNFAGFYYDIDGDLGTETLSTVITDGGKLSGDEPYGVNYATTAQKKIFGFNEWGNYQVMGFLGKRCIAGYVGNNLLDKRLLFEVLRDDDSETTMTQANPLELDQGYEIYLKSAGEDGASAYIELMKGEEIVDTKKITLGTGPRSGTYRYGKDMSGIKNLTILQIHIKNAFGGADRDIATVDGIWQISDSPLDIKEGKEYGEMKIANVDSVAGTVTLDNRGQQLILSKKGDIDLMPGFQIRTGAYDTGDGTLRYYVCRTITEPGTYEIRGQVATGDFTWSPQNFAGLYYDIMKDIGTETLTTAITEDNKLSGDSPYGVTYQSVAQMKGFAFEDWGYYSIIGFLSKGYFAGYTRSDELPDSQILQQESEDGNSMDSEQLEEILIDDDRESIVEKGESIKLKEGYELKIRGINQAGQCYMDLQKNGQVVDSKILGPSMDGATMADKTYYYKRDVGKQKGLVTIAIHFKNVYRDEDVASTTVDGIWQISEEPLSIAPDSKYGKLTIRTIDPSSGTLTMDNKDNQIILSRNKDISLTSEIRLKIADSYDLRYYVYRLVTIEPEDEPIAPTGSLPEPVEPQAQVEASEPPLEANIEQISSVHPLEQNASLSD